MVLLFVQYNHLTTVETIFKHLSSQRDHHKAITTVIVISMKHNVMKIQCAVHLFLFLYLGASFFISLAILKLCFIIIIIYEPAMAGRVSK